MRNQIIVRFGIMPENLLNSRQRNTLKFSDVFKCIAEIPREGKAVEVILTSFKEVEACIVATGKQKNSSVEWKRIRESLAGRKLQRAYKKPYKDDEGMWHLWFYLESICK